MIDLAGTEFELRMTSYELRSKKFRGRSPASGELWEAQRLAEGTAGKAGAAISDRAGKILFINHYSLLLPAPAVLITKCKIDAKRCRLV